MLTYNDKKEKNLVESGQPKSALANDDDFGDCE